MQDLTEIIVFFVVKVPVQSTEVFVCLFAWIMALRDFIIYHELCVLSFKLAISK